MAKEKSESRELLVEQLEEMAHYMELLGENDFKVRAFRKGADAIRASTDSLSAVVAGEVKVAGVGEGLKAAIKDFLDHGTIKAREELAAKVPPGVIELTKIPGLGPKKAMLIASELGIQTIGELEYACRENRLTGLKGFGQAIQDKILNSIEDLNRNAGKVRIDEAQAMAEDLETKFRKSLGKGAQIMRVGELGRHCEIVENFEFYFSGVSAKVGDAISKLDWSDEGLKDRRESPFNTDLAGFSGRLKNGLNLTLWISENTPDSRTVQWLCANEDVRDEISEAPHRFEGWESSWLETEWVDLGRTPKNSTYRRERHGGVKGIFHCHTNFSDGSATLEQMVKGAEARGYEYIGISDHSQTAFYAQGLKVEKLLEQSKMIKDLQKKTKIKIFHGIESDILADGALDYEKDVLDSFDFIVGSIHSRFKMEENVMTDRLVNALKNPRITMWGHPTGRLLLGRRGYGLRWDECLKAAAENGVAIEFNANPHRLDVDWRMGAELEKYETYVCINPDAHSVEGLDDTVYGEYMAEKAMIPRERILNMLGRDEMEKYLWERKQRNQKSKK